MRVNTDPTYNQKQGVESGAGTSYSKGTTTGSQPNINSQKQGKLGPNIVDVLKSKSKTK